MNNVFQFLNYALITPRHLQRFMERLATVDLTKFSRARLQDDDEDDEEDPADDPWWKKFNIWGDPLPAPSMEGSDAIIPMKGVLTSGLPTIFRALEFADTEEIAGWIREATEDKSAARIVMPSDSPGGMYTGTPELAAEIDRATSVKPVIVHTKGMLDSAAYWAASQATAIYCTQSSDVGCIGVYQMNYDFTDMLRDFGVKAEMIKSGDLKGAGHPHIPLSEAQRQQFQEEIDAIGAEFRAAVTAKRSLVAEDSMRGQSFIGTEAAARNLVAGVRSFESLF
jgi:capsid assembly protease